MAAHDQAQANLLNATTIASLLDPALQQLEIGLVGYPTSVPCAAPLEAGPLVECPHPDCAASRPCPKHDVLVDLTPTERASLTRDVAAKDKALLLESVRKAVPLLRTAARISSKWGLPGVTDTTVAKSLAAIDAGIWCANCSRYGHKTPRAVDNTVCDFCKSFKLDWKEDAPAEVLETRVLRGGRIYESDIRRILAKLKEQRRVAAAARKAEEKAERAAAKAAAKDAAA